MRLTVSLIIFFYVLISGAFAQSFEGIHTGELFLAMKKLKVCGSVLYIAAHPDDENTRLLTYLSKEKLFHTAYLSLTRGEGGQNLIGEEQGVPLGLIRTQELLAARKIDGAEQYFTSAKDFGYSKTQEETLLKWNKEEVLRDMVRIIRQFQPDIIITRFPPDKRAGHGHHAASALLAMEAFDAAADSNRYTEQLKNGLKTWKTRQLFWNTYNFSSANTITPDQLKIDVGGFNSVLGKSYGEIAAESRSQHKSQGFGVSRQRGEQFEYFVQMKGDSSKVNIFNDLPVFPSFGSQTKEYVRLTDEIVKKYRHDSPESSIPLLYSLYKTLLKAEESKWRNQKLKEIISLITNCAGIYCEAFTDQPYGVIGDSMFIKTQFIKRLPSAIQLKSICLSTPFSQTKTVDSVLPVNRSVVSVFNILIPDNHTVSQPYWISNINHSFFETEGSPENAPAISVDFELLIDGGKFNITRPVLYKHTDPVRGELFERIEIIPPYTFMVEPDLVILKDTSSVKGVLSIKKWINNKTDTLYPGLCVSGKCINLERIIIDSMFRKGTEKKYPFTLSYDHVQDQMELLVKQNNYTWNQCLKIVAHDHIPDATYFEDVILTVKKIGLKIKEKKIGYIKGAGDNVQKALLQMGYQVKEIDEKNIQSSLAENDAVVIGVRAYNVHDWLSDVHPYLMQFVNKGGVLIVQYNTSSQVGPLKKSNWPYPLTISRNRVSEENAEVEILDKNHPIFHYPNTITENDFSGWIQERSVYEANPTDNKFIPLISMHDKNEEPLRGSLLVADYGKGRIVYTSLSFFRQLPVGVPGAYRLFANLLTKP